MGAISTTPEDNVLHDYKLDHWNISHVTKGQHIAVLIWSNYCSVKSLLPYVMGPLQPMRPTRWPSVKFLLWKNVNFCDLYIVFNTFNTSYQIRSGKCQIWVYLPNSIHIMTIVNTQKDASADLFFFYFVLYFVGCCCFAFFNWMEQINLFTQILMVSYQKGPIRQAYAWQIGPFWQDTLAMIAWIIKDSAVSLDMAIYYNMTVWILAGSYISFTIAAGLIRLHMPGVKKSRV